MPHTTSGLWAKVIDFENLYLAYQAARLGKRYQRDVMLFASNLEENLINIQNHLIWKSWAPGPHREFVVKEPKLRLIQAPPFADRIIHHALVRVIEPYFERKFIADSYACRVGKGTQRAVMRTQHFLRVAKRNWGDGAYVVKCDISKYFASILHKVLMGQLSVTISDKDVLWLWQTIIAAYGHENGLGLPVGALTSQLGANVVLNRLDHIAKDDMGLRYYVRYMDDFLAIVHSKAEAQRVLQAFDEAVRGLGLSLNPKTAIHPWQRGVDFCGYRIWPTHILPRKRNIKRARADFKHLMKQYYSGQVEMEHVRERVMSFIAYAKHCQARRTVENILGEIVLIPGLRDIPEKLSETGNPSLTR
ncbi:alpha/beta hydrolase [Alcaligenaceae bacterium]|nr:alpha/beta hydrolase [Alcaligenaceae bacterium]